VYCRSRAVACVDRTHFDPPWRTLEREEEERRREEEDVILIQMGSLVVVTAVIL